MFCKGQILLFWPISVEGLRPARLVALLRSGGNFSEAEETATIKIASKAESRVVNLSPTNRKRGGGLVSYKNQREQKQATTSEVQSRTQASARPEVSKR